MKVYPRRCLVVRCGDPDPEVAREHGCFAMWFRNAIDPSVELTVLDARVDALPLAALDGVGAVVVSGSPHAVYEPHPWIPSLEALVRAAAVERALPLLGVCFGHQLLAKALGGEVARNPSGREMGTIDVHLDEGAHEEPIFQKIPRRFRAQATHRDTVLRPPPGARVLATSSKDRCQAFRAGRHAWGVQFHPEITAPILRGYVRSRREVLRAEGADPERVHASVLDDVEGRRVLDNFIGYAFQGLAVTAPA